MRGILNHSSICYAISCIQLLSQLPLFDGIMKRLSPTTPLLREWIEVYRQLSDAAATQPINITLFMREFCALHPAFQLSQQCDAAEFLSYLIEDLHASLAVVTEPPPSPPSVIRSQNDLFYHCHYHFHRLQQSKHSLVTDIFYSIQCVQTVFASEQTYSPEPFFILYCSPVDAPSPPSIYDYLATYIKAEQCTESITKTTLFWSLPRILIVRFPHLSSVVVEQTLDASSYVIGYNRDNYQYTLMGICMHYGNQMGGHYVSVVRSDDDGKWYHCNDQHISSVDMFADSTSVVVTHAYLVVYMVTSG